MSAEVCVRDRRWFSVAWISNMDAGIRKTEAKKVHYGADLNNRSADEAKMNRLDTVRERDSAFKVRIQR